MHKEVLSVAISYSTHDKLSDFLCREDGQEDLVFALWTPSHGNHRTTALIHTIIYPEENDRNVHGNVSFNKQYFSRVCSRALKKGYGIAFLHSHPSPGWQSMSEDDIIAEAKISTTVESVTNLPLVGMTISSDRIWSARFWKYIKKNKCSKVWCDTVRVVGKYLKVDFNNTKFPKPLYYH